MQNLGTNISKFGVERHGLINVGNVYWHLSTAALYEHTVQRREGAIVHLGPLNVRTGDHTGRSPNDRFIVRETEVEDEIWWGDVNRSLEPEHFESLYRRMQAYLQYRDLYVFDGYVGADPRYRMKVRIISELPWHNLFARNMFIREFDPDVLRNFVPEFTVINAPGFRADPELDGTNSQTFILLSFAKKLVLIGNTHYAGENKKSIFSAMNYYLPRQGVLSMHCSANYGRDKDDVALFFGLSGTGKTTLSAAPDRTLIGDDEHGWSDDGIFNLEGGCYAKVIRLDPEGEPEIYQTTRRFGTILENVAYDNGTRQIDLNDASLTENTRASYPVTHLDNVDQSGMAGHPRHIVFLTTDAFGVLPPISKLTREQAMYHFMSGYTAKVAGTEMGVTEPVPNFSACFGAPFLPLPPSVYADLLGEKIDRHDASVWLINTGWTGGPYGVGSRIKLGYTRRMVSAILNDELNDAVFSADPVFGLSMPDHVDGVPDTVLQPRRTWADPSKYDRQAQRLAQMFQENFRQFDANVEEGVRQAGPRAGALV